MISLDIPLEHIDSLHWSEPDLYIYTKNKEKLVKFLIEHDWKDQWTGGDSPQPTLSFFERAYVLGNEYVAITDDLDTFDTLALSQRLATKLNVNNDNPNKGYIFKALLYGKIE